MKNKRVLIILFIGILLICIGIGYNIYLFNDNDSVDSKNIEKTENIDNDDKKDETLPIVSNSSDNKNSAYPDSNYYKESKDGSLTNTSEKIKKVHKNGNISIENMSITFSPEKEYFADYNYVVKNIGKSDIESLEFTIIFIFSDGTKRDSSPIKIENLGVGKSKKIEKQNYVSIVGAEDYEIKIESSN